MSFILTKKARTTALQSLCYLLFVGSVLVGVNFFVYIDNSEVSVGGLIFSAVIFTLVAASWTPRILQYIHSKESWVVQIDSSSFRLAAPSEDLNGSFSCKLEEIRALETTKQYRKKGRISYIYTIALKDKRKFTLSFESGLDLTKIAKALKDFGVSEDVTTLSRSGEVIES